jgi:hypothetical protein
MRVRPPRERMLPMAVPTAAGTDVAMRNRVVSCVPLRRAAVETFDRVQKLARQACPSAGWGNAVRYAARMVGRMTAGLRISAVLWVAACGGSAVSDGGWPSSAGAPTGGETLAPGEAVPLGGDDPCPPQPLSLNDTLAAVLADTLAQPAASRPFLRYVSMGEFRPGPCAADEEVGGALRDLERARQAVSKAVNSLSREPLAVVPEAVGPEALLLRLDLRDYGWQRPVALAGERFDDVWQAVAARSAIALELQGGTANELFQHLGTRVPVLLSSGFVATASKAELYYAALRLPATLAELKRELGIDAGEDLDAGPWARATFSNSGTSKQVRGVARYRGSALGDGYFWQTFDYAPSTRSDVLYLEPLSTQADGHQVLFSLPNGLPAYFTTDGDGARLAESLFSVDPAQNNGRARVVSSCVSCHNGGIIAFTDAARGFVEDNVDLFSEAVIARVRETFPSGAEMAAFAEADSQRIVGAAELAGQPFGAPDPVSRTFLDYDLELTFDRLAAELFFDRASLIERLPSLPEDMAAAATSGVLERRVFEARYLEAACALYAMAESSPVGCP